MELIPVTNIQRFSTHDGEGIRTTVFLKGCPLRCSWCHNPETQSTEQQIYYTAQYCIGCGACAGGCPGKAHTLNENGYHEFWADKCRGYGTCIAVCPSGAIEGASRLMSIEEIIHQVMKDKAFYGKDGGMTLSGGEPMMHPEASIGLLKMAKAQGISTALETSGYFDRQYIPQLAEYTDYFLWDYKDSSRERHKAYTGFYPDKILENLFLLDQYDVKIILRCIIVRNVNGEMEHYRAIADTYHALSHCTGVELLPYHPYGGSKMEQLGYGDNGRKEWIPSSDEIDNVILQLKRLGCKMAGR